MKPVSILVSNYNGFEATQLCIESIRHYTNYPDYKIIVYDDYSSYPDEEGKRLVRNMRDIEYLRECQDKGWIRLIEGMDRRTHGGSLNVLVNEVCDTPYAIILDNDIQIRGHGWLTELVKTAERTPNLLAIVDFKAGGFARACYRTAIHLWWIGLLDMEAYRDGMQVDWKLSRVSRLDWPYTDEFAEYYPPENCKWTSYFNSVAYIQKDKFDANLVCNDPGAQFYIRAKYYNPKDYKVIPLPMAVRAMYHHFSHISMISVPHETHEKAVADARTERFAKIKEELKRLREKA